MITMQHAILLVALATMSFVLIANAHLAESASKYKDAEKFAALALLVWLGILIDLCCAFAWWIITPASVLLAN
jgi:hypothetical protein